MSQGTVGPYRILRQLGRGGMGVVYAVEDPALPGRQLALKLLERTALSDRGVERFRREGEALARVRHPGVVAVHAAGEVPQGHYLVTDLVQGEDLKTVLERGALASEEVARIGERLSSALAALHAEGVLHRDLKPENVILQPNREPVLIDFGLAKDLRGEDLTQTGTLLGTPAYMAPEQANGDLSRLADPRVDVYGLGATLFGLAVGRPPFVSDDRGRMAMFTRVMQGQVEWPGPGELDPDLRAVLRKALHVRQSGRYGSVEELGADLRRIREGERVRPRRWPVVALALALLAAALVYALQPEPPAPLVLELNWPGEVVREPKLTLSGAVRGLQGSSAVVRCGRAKARARADVGGSFRLTVSLEPGENLLRVVARERDREAVAERGVVFQQAPDWYYELAEAERPALPLPGGLRFSEAAGEYLLGDDLVLLWIPPGRYQRGGGRLDAKRRHWVRLTRGFFLGKHEVTFGQYWDAGFDVTLADRRAERDMPAVGVTWEQARAFCERFGGRLPTESEWEYAARGPEGRRFPWGDDPPGKAQVNLGGVVDGVEWLAPIQAFPGDVSPFGARGMAGNAAEWTQDWALSYDEVPEGTELVDPQGPTRPGGGKRIVRGGGIGSPRVEQASRRQHRFPGEAYLWIGFRLVLDPS